MRSPVIGLTTYRQDAAYGVWHQLSDVLPTEYAASVEAAGGVPLLLPPVESATAEAARAVVARLDALVVTGGRDVDPARYAAQPHPRTTGWQQHRDAWELALLDAADEVGLAVLGICRGMQVMAVHAGGSLEQHVPDRVGSDAHDPGGDRYSPNHVTVRAGTRLAGLVGDWLEVPCHHHQSVREHPGFQIAAYADDGTPEAMEAPGDRFRLAVQWHPETVADAGLFAGIVAAACAHRPR